MVPTYLVYTLPPSARLREPRERRGDPGVLPRVIMTRFFPDRFTLFAKTQLNLSAYCINALPLIHFREPRERRGDPGVL